MLLTLSNLKSARGSKKDRKRVGRGGKRGTYSGRGLKGQKARSGGKRGLKLRGFRQTLQRIHKNRGFKSLNQRVEIVNIGDLDKKFDNNDTVDIKILREKGLIDKINKGVKILGKGELTKKLIVKANAFSESAKKAIEKAGGKIEIVS